MNRSARIKARQALRERDGDECWICGKPMRFDAQRPYEAPELATIDHHTPLSRGGSDDMANLKLAHSSCNSARGSVAA